MRSQDILHGLKSYRDGDVGAQASSAVNVYVGVGVDVKAEGGPLHTIRCPKRATGKGFLAGLLHDAHDGSRTVTVTVREFVSVVSGTSCNCAVFGRCSLM